MEKKIDNRFEKRKKKEKPVRQQTGFPTSPWWCVYMKSISVEPYSSSSGSSINISGES